MNCPSLKTKNKNESPKKSTKYPLEQSTMLRSGTKKAHLGPGHSPCSGAQKSLGWVRGLHGKGSNQGQLAEF